MIMNVSLAVGGAKVEQAGRIATSEREETRGSGFSKTRHQLRHELAEAIASVKSKKVKKLRLTADLEGHAAL